MSIDAADASPGRARVWIADDSRLARATAVSALGGLYDIEQFDSAPPVLEALMSRRPDALILDWHMPDMSGIEACKFVREVADDAQLPILILTSDTDRESLLTAFAAGANDHVKKPFDADELRSRVATLVRIKLLHDRLSLAEARLREEAAHRERFVAILAHDLRQPLHVVTMAAPILTADDVAAESRRDIGARVQKVAARMQRMIGELLEFARSRASEGMPLTRSQADIVIIARGIVEEIRSAHAGATILLVTTEAEPGVWDTDRIAQVLSNLIENALHHRLKGAPVHVTITSDAETVTLVVSNEGALATPQEELFHPFKRGGSSRRGLGLGLYIVDQIARAHGGSAAAASVDGTVHVTVRLPRSSAA